MRLLQSENIQVNNYTNGEDLPNVAKTAENSSLIIYNPNTGH